MHPSSSFNSTQTIPEIRIAFRKEDGAPEVPPRPRRYTSGNGSGMEKIKRSEQNTTTNLNNNSLLPGLRQGRSGTMGTTTTPIGSQNQQQETRSSSISPSTFLWGILD
jgi:hypothetical protein